MTNTKKTRMALLAPIASMLILAVSAVPVDAATQSFIAFINSGQENDPLNTSNAFGIAVLTFDDVTKVLCYNISFNALVGTETAAHFHGPAPAGQNAGILFDISPSPPGPSSLGTPKTGCVGPLTPQQEDDLRNGLLYINIHSSAFPGGEIRGQVLPATIPPNINAGGVVNGASFAPGAALAHGSIVSVFGTELAFGTQFAGAVPLPTTLGGATMQFDSSVAIPKFFASSLQFNIQVPWELAGQAQADLTDVVGGVTGNTETVNLASFSPGLFATNQAGSGQGAILISGAGGAVAAPTGTFPGSRPVMAGEFIEIFCTGLGAVTNQPATGAAASSSPLSETTTTPIVTIGGVAATVTFSGLAPGFVGLYQVNVQVPANAPVGDGVNVVLSIGGPTSNTVTIAVQ